MPVIHEAAAMSLAALLYAAFGARIRSYVDMMSCRTDVYQAGYDAGFEKGYTEGRRVAKPVVIPSIRLGP